MSVDGGLSGGRGPRRARYLIPRETPRRAEIVAVLTMALLLAHLVLAQVAGLVAVALYAVTRLGRFRRSWLLFPMVAGAVWALLLGPTQAVDMYLTGPRRIVDAANAAFFDLLHAPAHVGRAYSTWPAWFGQQLPIALVIGSAEALAAAWLAWLHTDEWKLPEPRPGLIVWARRLLNVRRVRGGGVVTKDGACLGVNGTLGQQATLSWREVGGNVLVLGAARSGKSTTCFQLAHAAVRRRKPLVTLDMSGDPALVERTRAVCQATGTPFYLFTPVGPCYYEPLRGGDPARRTELAMSLVDWHGTAEQYRRGCARYVQDVFATLDAAPGDPRSSVLDELVHMLSPAALQARAARIPVYHPHRSALLERVRVSAHLASSDPQTLAALTAQLQEVHASVAGRWLRPSPAHVAAQLGQTGQADPQGQQAYPEIDLARIVRERAVAMFSLDASVHGRSAAKVATLAVHELITIAAELRGMGVDGDGLVWLDGLDSLPTDAVTDLLGRGRDAGLPVLLTSTAHPGDRVVERVGAYVIHRVSDAEAAEMVARLGGETTAVDERVESGQSESSSASSASFVKRPLLPASSLQSLDDGAFALVVKTPRHRAVLQARTVATRVPRRDGDGEPGSAVAVHGGGSDRPPESWEEQLPQDRRQPPRPSVG